MESPDSTVVCPQKRIFSAGIVFMCKSCNAVLGDSMSLCGTHKSLSIIACLRATDQVVVEKGLRVSVDGDLNGCAYYPLHCRACSTRIGFNLYSTSKAFSSLRGLFCLQKEDVTCYVLNARNLIPGLQLNIKQPSLGKKLEEVNLDSVN
ncbi:protein Mis18-beta [Pelodytes ibericus]